MKNDTNINNVEFVTMYSIASVVIASVVARLTTNAIPSLNEYANVEDIIILTIFGGSMLARATSTQAELYDDDVMKGMYDSITEDSKYQAPVMASISGVLTFFTQNNTMDAVLYNMGFVALMAAIAVTAKHLVFKKNVQMYNDNNSTSFSA